MLHFVLCSGRPRPQRSQRGFCASHCGAQPCTQSFIPVWEGKSFRALWFYSGGAEKFHNGKRGELLWEGSHIHDNLDALSRSSGPEQESAKSTTIVQNRRGEKTVTKHYISKMFQPCLSNHLLCVFRFWFVLFEIPLEEFLLWSPLLWFDNSPRRSANKDKSPRGLNVRNVNDVAKSF